LNFYFEFFNTHISHLAQHSIINMALKWHHKNISNKIMVFIEFWWLQHVFWLDWLWLHPNPKFEDIHNFHINSPIKKMFHEDAWLWISYHLPQYSTLFPFCCISHIVLLPDLQCVISTKEPPILWAGWVTLKSFHHFHVAIYVEAQTWTLASLPSLLSWIVSHGYDFRLRSYFDDEELENV
jgi:hypothetical protein